MLGKGSERRFVLLSCLSSKTMGKTRQTNQTWQLFLDNPPILEGGASLSAEPLDDGALLRFRHEQGSFELRAMWLAVPYPSGLRRMVAAHPDAELAVVARVPSGLDAAARELGVSYLDPAGHGRVVGPGFVYVVPPRAGSEMDQRMDRGPHVRAKQAEGRKVPGRGVSPFAPKASRIVRGLLVHPERRQRLSDLAGEVAVDPGNAHRVLAALIDTDLVERDRDEYLVADPGSLLEAWAEQARRPEGRIELPVGEDLAGAVAKVQGIAGEGSVVSGEFAAELLAPHLPATAALVHCVSPETWGAIARLADNWRAPLRRVGKIDVVLSDEGVAQFASPMNGYRVAAPVQVYVDLFRHPGRGREAAEHLRREVLGF